MKRFTPTRRLASNRFSSPIAFVRASRRGSRAETLTLIWAAW